MKIITVLILLATPIFAQETIPLRFNTYGLIFVKATVNDSLSATFILDTGAGIHAFSASMFRRVRTGAVSERYFTGFRNNGERLDMELFRISSIAVGSLREDHPLVGVYPLLDQWGIDGIISMNMFRHQAFTIDFTDSTLILETEATIDAFPQKAERIPLFIKDDRGIDLDLFVRLVLNGTDEAEVEFDTGSGFEELVINPIFIERLGLDTTQMVIDTSHESNPAMRTTLYKTTLATLAYSGAPSTTSRHVPVIFKKGLIYEGLVGSGMFRKRKLTIDIPHRSMIAR